MLTITRIETPAGVRSVTIPAGAPVYVERHVMASMAYGAERVTSLVRDGRLWHTMTDAGQCSMCGEVAEYLEGLPVIAL